MLEIGSSRQRPRRTRGTKTRHSPRLLVRCDCSWKARVRPKMSGQSLRCPRCRSRLRVPEVSHEADSQDPFGGAGLPWSGWDGVSSLLKGGLIVAVFYTFSTLVGQLGGPGDPAFRLLTVLTTLILGVGVLLVAAGLFDIVRSWIFLARRQGDCRPIASDLIKKGLAHVGL